MRSFLALHKSSAVSVVFDFNASLNNCIPDSPILLPVDLMRMKKSVLLMDVICVLFLLSSPSRLSSRRAVFDFSASLNDVVPVSPILLSVDLMRMEKSGLLTDAFVCCFFCLHHPDRVS